jgi:hypothetical protein
MEYYFETHTIINLHLKIRYYILKVDENGFKFAHFYCDFTNFVVKCTVLSHLGLYKIKIGIGSQTFICFNVRNPLFRKVKVKKIKFKKISIFAFFSNHVFFL